MGAVVNIMSLNGENLPHSECSPGPSFTSGAHHVPKPGQRLWDV